MNNEDAAIRRALDSLNAAAGDEPGAAEHPGMDLLEAYVEGRLSPERRADIDRLAARSPIVAQDLADLKSVHDSLAAPAGHRLAPIVARRDIRWGRFAVAAAVAAAVVTGAWLATRAVRVQPDAASPVARLTPAEQQRVDTALASGRIELPEQIQALRRAEGTLLGEPQAASFAPLSPMGTAVRSPRPAFTWSDAHADAYTVAVFDTSFTEVARSARVTGTSWTPEVELPQDREYVWQVTAHRGSESETAPRPPRPEARFRVLDAAARDRVAAFEARLSDEPLALAVLLAEEGLMTEVRAALARAAAVPATADAARTLLESLEK